MVQKPKGLIVGVDPGRNGGIAKISVTGELLHVETLPQAGAALRALLDELGGEVVIVEEQGPRPGEGVKGAFSLGVGYGRILGVIDAMGLRCEIVEPRLWKAAMGLSRSKTKSRVRAQQEWPMQAAVFEPSGSDGLAEAALIAAFWLKRHYGR